MNYLGHHHFCHTDCQTPQRLNELVHSVEQIKRVPPLFNALADKTRVKIIYALLLKPDLCVYEIAQLTDLTISAASHHLRLLKSMGLARSRKEGKLVRYNLYDKHVKIILEKALDHSNHLPTF